MSGRRRQGKSYLLEALCAAMGGFYFAATEATEEDLPAELDAASGDWWLLDGRDVVTMHYHPDGQFRGAEALGTPHLARYRIAADAAWQVGEPFNSWWDRHPQHHRTPSRAV